MSIAYPVRDRGNVNYPPNIPNKSISKGTGKSNGLKLTSKNKPVFGSVEDIVPRLRFPELVTIQSYIEEEFIRINENYEGEDREYLISMLAYNVGHMVLSIENYKDYSLRTLDKIFEQFGTTFEEVKQAIRRDLHWQEW